MSAKDRACRELFDLHQRIDKATELYREAKEAPLTRIKLELQLGAMNIYACTLKKRLVGWRGDGEMGSSSLEQEYEEVQGRIDRINAFLNTRPEFYQKDLMEMQVVAMQMYALSLKKRIYDQEAAVAKN